MLSAVQRLWCIPEDPGPGSLILGNHFASSWHCAGPHRPRGMSRRQGTSGACVVQAQGPRERAVVDPQHVFMFSTLVCKVGRGATGTWQVVEVWVPLGPEPW